MSFHSSLEMFQCQFWIYNVIGQGGPHDRSGDTEDSSSEATCPGTRCGEVSSCSRTNVGSRPDFQDGDAGSTATVVARVSNEGCNFENDAYVICIVLETSIGYMGTTLADIYICDKKIKDDRSCIKTDSALKTVQQTNRRCIYRASSVILYIE